MRKGYWIAILATAIGAVLVLASWYMAQAGIAAFWIPEILGFSLLVVFGTIGAMVLPFYYWSLDQSRGAGGLAQSSAPTPVKCLWCQAVNPAGSTVCVKCGRTLTPLLVKSATPTTDAEEDVLTPTPTSPGSASMSLAELDAYWRAEARVVGLMLSAAGPIILGLDAW
jgi:hypothetical protein